MDAAADAGAGAGEGVEPPTGLGANNDPSPPPTETLAVAADEPPACAGAGEAPVLFLSFSRSSFSRRSLSSLNFFISASSLRLLLSSSKLVRRLPSGIVRAGLPGAGDALAKAILRPPFAPILRPSTELDNSGVEARSGVERIGELPRTKRLERSDGLRPTRKGVPLPGEL